MANAIHVKDGVKFSRISPAGFRLLGALERTARRLKVDLTITSGTDGHLSDDPHTEGHAYDVRTHDLTDEQKQLVLKETMLDLAEDGNMLDAPILANGGLATLHFFGWLEHRGTEAEHLHFQKRKSVAYP